MMQITDGGRNHFTRFILNLWNKVKDGKKVQSSESNETSNKQR